MTNYYTSKGDEGQTDQLGMTRLSKSHQRIKALGAIDEASAALGLARAQIDLPEFHELIKAIQHDLYKIMTQVSLESPNPEKFPDLGPDRLSWLEEKISIYGDPLEKPKGFILPGENLASASLGIARSIIRRAERETVALLEDKKLYSENALPYLNRLSSLVFVLELMTAKNPPYEQE
jgi:cob(I)alamin adenosyltransferase